MWLPARVVCARANAKVAEFLFRKATTEGPQCVTAAIFWMKTRGGWREAPHTHHLSVSRIEDMSDEELIARLSDIEILMGITEPRAEPKLIDVAQSSIEMTSTDDYKPPAFTE